MPVVNQNIYPLQTSYVRNLTLVKKEAEPKKEVDPVELWWYNMISINPDHWKTIFKKLARTDWKKILYDSKLSPFQKFEKLFEIKVDDLMKKNPQLLGSLWTWLENTFSEKNLKKVETWVRTGEKVSTTFANLLNVTRNQPNIQNQVNAEMNLQDLESQAFTQSQSFLDTYSTPIIFAGVGLVLYLILKK
ncbi:MAG: hypothetical protein EHM58_04450 [Ignavibacteriae bacterium]|nr:MAG: hypothetical protein EHM58_04450 [Ignavibacteriota bacterium]